MGADELIAAIRAAIRDEGAAIRKEVLELLLPLSWQQKYGEYMTRQQCVKEFGKDPSSIDRWLRSGLLPRKEGVRGVKIETRAAYEFYNGKPRKDRNKL